MLRYNNFTYLCNVFDSRHCFIILNFKKMKKLVYSLAVLFSVALVSCSGNKAAEATDSETLNVEVAEETAVVATDSDTTVVAAEVVEAAPAAENADSAK